jgi:hypothetical protein
MFDESETKFLAGVKTGKRPTGTRDGGNVYWFHQAMRVLGERGRRLTERHHLGTPGDIKSECWALMPGPYESSTTRRSSAIAALSF